MLLIIILMYRSANLLFSLVELERGLEASIRSQSGQRDRRSYSSSSSSNNVNLSSYDRNANGDDAEGGALSDVSDGEGDGEGEGEKIGVAVTGGDLYGNSDPDQCGGGSGGGGRSGASDYYSLQVRPNVRIRMYEMRSHRTKSLSYSRCLQPTN